MVTYKKDDEHVTLSLRQADILHALAQDEKLCTEGGCVPALQDITVEASKYVQSLDLNSKAHVYQGSAPDFPPRVWPIYVGSYSWEAMGYWV